MNPLHEYEPESALCEDNEYSPWTQRTVPNHLMIASDAQFEREREARRVAHAEMVEYRQQRKEAGQ